MRRYITYLLLFLGVFLIVLAAAVKFVVAPAAVKAPLTIPEKYTNVIASGQNFNYFDAISGQNIAINVWITRKIVGDYAAGNGSVAVYDESLCLTRAIPKNAHPGCVSKSDPLHRLISNSTDRVAFNRKSAYAVNDPKYGGNVDGNTDIKHEGLGYKFPIDTEKKTYLYFDTVVGKAFPMKYVDQETLEGLTVYKFVQKMVDEHVYTNNTFPSLYTDTRTVWVEPTTGAIIKGQEDLNQRLTGRASLSPTSAVVEPGLVGIVALQGRLAFTPETVKLQAQLAKDNLPKIHLVRLWLPLISLILGVIALVAAIVLLRRRGPAETNHDHVDGEPRPTPGPAVPTEGEPAYGPPAEDGPPSGEGEKSDWLLGSPQG